MKAKVDPFYLSDGIIDILTKYLSNKDFIEYCLLCKNNLNYLNNHRYFLNVNKERSILMLLKRKKISIEWIKYFIKNKTSDTINGLNRSLNHLS